MQGPFCPRAGKRTWRSSARNGVSRLSEALNQALRFPSCAELNLVRVILFILKPQHDALFSATGSLLCLLISFHCLVILQGCVSACV